MSLLCESVAQWERALFSRWEAHTCARAITCLSVLQASCPPTFLAVWIHFTMSCMSLSTSLFTWAQFCSLLFLPYVSFWSCLVMWWFPEQMSLFLLSGYSPRQTICKLMSFRVLVIIPEWVSTCAGHFWGSVYLTQLATISRGRP